MYNVERIGYLLFTAKARVHHLIGNIVQTGTQQVVVADAACSEQSGSNSTASTRTAWIPTADGTWEDASRWTSGLPYETAAFPSAKVGRSLTWSQHPSQPGPMHIVLSVVLSLVLQCLAETRCSTCLAIVQREYSVGVTQCNAAPRTVAVNFLEFEARARPPCPVLSAHYASMFSRVQLGERVKQK